MMAPATPVGVCRHGPPLANPCKSANRRRQGSASHFGTQPESDAVSFRSQLQLSRLPAPCSQLPVIITVAPRSLDQLREFAQLLHRLQCGRRRHATKDIDLKPAAVVPLDGSRRRGTTPPLPRARTKRRLLTATVSRKRSTPGRQTISSLQCQGPPGTRSVGD